MSEPLKRPEDELRRQVVDVIEKGDDMTIATVGPDGCPHATTVSYVSDGLAIWFGTSSESRKANNLAWCDRVSLTIDLPYSSWDDIQSITPEGRVRPVTDPEERRRVGELMFAKFPQITKYVSRDDPGELALFRIDGETVALLDYSKGFGHTDHLRL